MIGNKLVSVIIPIWNRQEYIKNTINSILTQTYQNLEILCVDDCSSDESVLILEQINDTRLRIIKLSQNSGRPAVPRNIALKQAKGEYIAFCDDDDIWNKRKIELQLEAMKKYSFDICFTGFEYFGMRKGRPSFQLRAIRFFIPFSLIFSNSILNSSVMITSQLINRVGFLNEELSLRAIEDYQYWLRAYFKGSKFHFIKDTMVYYRIHSRRISSKDEGLELRGSMVQSLKFDLSLRQWLYLNLAQKLFVYIRRI